MLKPALVEDWQTGGFGLYIHWPFCEAKCPYCDFNSHVSRFIDQDAWCEALLSELNRAAAHLGKRALNSIYLGGGTPSLMAPETVAALIHRASELWSFSNTIEITLEANPNSVERQRFADYHAAGVNRVSLGVQALNDPDLKRLGRLHSAEDAKIALDVALNTFGRVSFDLMCARQNQTLASWEAELTQALGFGTDHLSLYQLTIEPGTAFGERYKAGTLRGLPDDDLGADMFMATQEICEAYEMPAYEVSNHARRGQESRHNMVYWQYGDYIGIGPGAHGRVTRNGVKFATETYLNPGEWLSSVREGCGTSTETLLSANEQAEEYLMMSLRTSLGMDLQRFKRLSGKDLPKDPITEMEEIGLISQDGDRLQITKTGRPLLNAVTSRLLVV